VADESQKTEQIAKKGYLRVFLTSQMPSKSRLKALDPREHLQKRWHPDSNWGMEALQASALPLGDATIG
jgi:hypothetical protein